MNVLYNDEDFEEKTLDSTCVYSGKIVELYVDTVMLPNGHKSKREVIKSKDAVGVIPVTKEGKLVLVRQYRYPARVELLEIPAGRIEIGEEPDHAAIRELSEETGYKVNRLEKLSEFFPAVGFATESMHLYYAEVEPESGQHPDEDEFVQVKLADIVDLPQMVKDGKLRDAKTVAAVYYLGWKLGLK